MSEEMRAAVEFIMTRNKRDMEIHQTMIGHGHRPGSCIGWCDPNRAAWMSKQLANAAGWPEINPWL